MYKITNHAFRSRHLDQLERRLKNASQVTRNPFMLKAHVDEEHQLAIFPDGRILVQGTTDIPFAKTLVARFIGI